MGARTENISRKLNVENLQGYTQKASSMYNPCAELSEDLCSVWTAAAFIFSLISRVRFLRNRRALSVQSPVT